MNYDLFLLKVVGQSDLFTGVTFLRIYEWAENCVSYGYHQSEEAVRKIVGMKLPIVKRPTGGGIVFHGEDLCFSFIFNNNSPFFSSHILEMYEKIINRVRNAFSLLGVELVKPAKKISRVYNSSSSPRYIEPLCFSRVDEYELTFNGKKVLGCAIRKTDEGVLAQGSIDINAIGIKNRVEDISCALKTSLSDFKPEIPNF